MGCCCNCNTTCKLGVYVLATNGFIDNGVNALFGIDPRVWRALPNEGLALLKVRQEVPSTAGSLAVALAVPTCGTVTTVGDGGSTVTSIPLVNVLGDTLAGAEFASGTERLVYFNKCSLLVRLLDCCVAAAAAS